MTTDRQQRHRETANFEPRRSSPSDRPLTDLWLRVGPGVLVLLVLTRISHQGVGKGLPGVA
ncbi:MAG: hypothetical protein OXH92_01660, partial [Bryobacterales bacterium]|nr:hypothetical protein [Bryobacterales bacterium]